jgi:5'-methylthioadenosine phosphorylase
MRTIGIIGGSGLYAMDGLTSVEELAVDTPFGRPSDTLITGHLGDARLVFLPRHGRGHVHAPHEINFRANIHALKQVGVEWIIAVSAVGSMKEEIAPGDLVVVDQYIDRTRRRSTFFEGGVAGHVAFSDPTCRALGALVADSAAAAGSRVHKKGTYLTIDGPQFSTRAESLLYRSWGIDVIGMTAMPEAKLAREAEICYVTLALATDYDCWHESETPVTVEAVVAVMQKNVSAAREAIRRTASVLPIERTCACASAARGAVMTDPARISPETRSRLKHILGRYL